MFAIVIFIIILTVLVMIHEFGHFIMAKRAGIGVEEFGFGLPPRIWGKKYKGTIYSINWLPFGGFVRLVGEDPTDKNKDRKDSFSVKSIGQRSLVVVAGVFMNLVLAVAIFYVVVFALGFKVNMPLLVEHNFKFVNQTRQVLIGDINENSAAAKAGIKSGDSIVAIDSQKIESISQLQGIVRQSDGKELVLTLENPVNNRERQVKATPVYSERLKAPALGIGLGELYVLNYDTLPQKLFSGFIHSYNTIEYSLDVFKELIGFSVKERSIAAVSEGVSGPIGIAKITSQAVALGPLSVLQLVGLLSLNLAFLNILPIPALDGGRFFFIIVEAVTRRKVHATFEKWVHTVGFVVLIGLILLVTYNDIFKLIHKQF
jgi:regulator of sigma E protease